jgi:hypothetical protein
MYVGDSLEYLTAQVGETETDNKNESEPDVSESVSVPDVSAPVSESVPEPEPVSESVPEPVSESVPEPEPVSESVSESVSDKRKAMEKNLLNAMLKRKFDDIINNEEKYTKVLEILENIYKNNTCNNENLIYDNKNKQTICSIILNIKTHLIQFKKDSDTARTKLADELNKTITALNFEHKTKNYYNLTEEEVKVLQQYDVASQKPEATTATTSAITITEPIPTIPTPAPTITVPIATIPTPATTITDPIATAITPAITINEPVTANAQRTRVEAIQAAVAAIKVAIDAKKEATQEIQAINDAITKKYYIDTTDNIEKIQKAKTTLNSVKQTHNAVKKHYRLFINDGTTSVSIQKYNEIANKLKQAYFALGIECKNLAYAATKAAKIFVDKKKLIASKYNQSSVKNNKHKIVADAFLKVVKEFMTEATTYKKLIDEYIDIVTIISGATEAVAKLSILDKDADALLQYATKLNQKIHPNNLMSPNSSFANSSFAGGAIITKKKLITRVAASYTLKGDSSRKKNLSTRRTHTHTQKNKNTNNHAKQKSQKHKNHNKQKSQKNT